MIIIKSIIQFVIIINNNIYLHTSNGATCRRACVSAILPWALRFTKPINNSKLMPINPSVLHKYIRTAKPPPPPPFTSQSCVVIQYEFVTHEINPNLYIVKNNILESLLIKIRCFEYTPN